MFSYYYENNWLNSFGPKLCGDRGSSQGGYSFSPSKPTTIAKPSHLEAPRFSATYFEYETRVQTQMDRLLFTTINYSNRSNITNNIIPAVKLSFI